ncbi:MAG: glucosyltransferase [Lachnospiraceae bacterium]|nr:glucosyltransferase [Lachnospiraceae bacterium]
MSKIAFFCIPAHGHTNPTLGVVKELISRGNEVWYYSYDIMKEKIESTGAKYISCDPYDIQMQLKPEDADRVGKDIAFSTEILVKTTLALDEAILKDMKAWNPDCIVGDSVATWGKLTAMKLGVPFICSTTTFAFNKYSARIMKQDIGQLFQMMFSMGKSKKFIRMLQEKGYPVKNIISIVQNDNDTNTIVYTSPEFQPFSETFSDKYLFVGPSIPKAEQSRKQSKQKHIYISLGTVNNQVTSFFKNCIEAFKNTDYRVTMSVGNIIDLKQLGEIPENIKVERSVNQIEVLNQSDVFITHCGMNSVSEALYYQVPLVLFPQTNEQGGVAYRVNELGAGKYLKENNAESIRASVEEVLTNPSYKQNAVKIAESFFRCGGAKAAADFIERKAAFH